MKAYSMPLVELIYPGIYTMTSSDITTEMNNDKSEICMHELQKSPLHY